MDFDARGIQTRSLSAHSAHFVLKLSTFSLLYWGAISYYPRRPIMGKVKFTQLQNWMSKMDSNAWGIQTGPLATHSAQLVLKILHPLHFHTGEPFLDTPEAKKWKGEFTQLQNRMLRIDCNASGIQTGPCAAHSAHFVLKLFHLFDFYTGEPFFITPEGQ